ncbi:hypothetical protein DFH08DRAFT_803335 [Mycena albidolilacea]|uniref:Uncharacterized protein n=1 Tax=Mycena albidolilacea TaxID=1033008 RepID=A0AAD7ACM9_9AGAR|nr:hypothetical protein DFH08DRAFT_803335 [Mycena albidolilacea]
MLQQPVEHFDGNHWLKICTRDQYIPTGSDGFHRNSVKYIGSQLEQEPVECDKFHWGIVHRDAVEDIGCRWWSKVCHWNPVEIALASAGSQCHMIPASAVSTAAYITAYSITFLSVNLGHTPCQRPACGQPYYVHEPLEDPTPSQVPIPHPSSTSTRPPDPVMSLVPSLTSTVKWAQAPPTGQTTDEHRHAMAKYHRTWGAIDYHHHAHLEYPELYPNDPRLVGSKGSAWATVFNDFNLLFKFEVPVKADGTHERDTRFESFVWTLFSAGIKPKPGFERKISVAGVHWYEFTVVGLSKQKSVPDPVNPAGLIYFIGPAVWGCGPYPTCLLPAACSVALELMQRKALILSGPIDCLDICPSSRSVAPAPRRMAPALALVPPKPPLFNARADSDKEPMQYLPLFDAAHDLSPLNS